ncbi:MAG: flagellar biosynthesis protein FliQ [Gammaproteobacteria bacterium]|nr:flagellar biosynthesis protein FliQ [Gammaproteobacteria bacterium]MDH5594179.1 flagellar biosynthesis protein FliQ [Gammaproteobacteria bacterium]MDH5614589.1 flagellar biosynthesis protein FliQ [Gammaproteobacteria bacterium]
MTPDSIVTLMQQTVQVIMILVAVILLPALAVGLLVSMFQAATQINEMTLSFIPKLLVTLLVLMIGGSWLLKVILDYSQRLIENIPFMIG